MKYPHNSFVSVIMSHVSRQMPSFWKKLKCFGSRKILCCHSDFLLSSSFLGGSLSSARSPFYALKMECVCTSYTRLVSAPGSGLVGYSFKRRLAGCMRMPKKFTVRDLAGKRGFDHSGWLMERSGSLDWPVFRKKSFFGVKGVFLFRFATDCPNAVIVGTSEFTERQRDEDGIRVLISFPETDAEAKMETRAKTQTREGRKHKQHHKHEMENPKKEYLRNHPTHRNKDPRELTKQTERIAPLTRKNEPPRIQI